MTVMKNYINNKTNDTMILYSSDRLNFVITGAISGLRAGYIGHTWEAAIIFRIMDH